MWAQITEQIKRIWSNFTTWQKVTLAGVGIAALAGIFTLVIMAGNPRMEPLYDNLDPRDAGAVVARLQEQNIDYQLANEGKTILVPAKDVYQLRLDMAGQIDFQGIVGFESFNETRFGETDTDKRVRFLVALQGELTRTVEELDEVEKAKVHIALPQPSLFIRDQKEPTASVLLRLKPYATLKPEQVKSVMSFVSHSVEGLKPQNVTIMDVNGNLLSEGVADEGNSLTSPRISVSQLALKQEYEKNLSASVQSMLERTRGPGKAVVRANVSMDFDQVETVSETYGDPVLRSEQLKEESSSGTDTPSGGNPADSNMGGPSYGSVTGSGTSEYQLTERTRNYEVDKTVQTKVVAPGKVTRVSLSVLIDGEISAEEQEKISEAVSSAAGIDLSRGDQVAVVAIPFNFEEQQKLEQQMAAAERSARIRQYIEMGAYALAALLAAGIFILILKNRSRILAYFRQPAIAGIDQTAAAMGETSLNSAFSQEVTEKKMLRSQVEKLVQNNPEEVAKVLKTWMAEE